MVEHRDLDHLSAPYSDRQGAVRYLQAFRRHWPLILLLVIVTVSVTAAITLTKPKTYASTADLRINAISANDDLLRGFSLFQQSLDGSSVVVTAVRAFNSPEVRHAALAKLPRRNVSFSVTPLSQADVVTVTASARSPQLAADAANSFARVVVKQRTDLFHRELHEQIAILKTQIVAIPVDQRPTSVEYGQLAAQVATLNSYLGRSDPTVQLGSVATPPASASSPRPKLSIAVAFIAALLLGCGVAVALEFFNPRLADEDELRLTHRLPILARIPRLSNRVANRYLMGLGVLPRGAWKGYRTLRAVLANVGQVGGYPRSVLVTSATPGDGKTMTAVNLAITLAAADLRVILVDGDFHRPMIGSIFNVTAKPYGLMRLLAGADVVDDVLVEAPSHAGLRLLVGAKEHPYHMNNLDTDRFRNLLSNLEKVADVVVIDSPPVPEVAEALSMAEAAEAVLVSVRLGHTRRDKLEHLRELLARRGVAPLGVVLTSRTRSDGGDTYYDYASDVPAPPARESGRPARLSRPKAVRAVDQ